MNKRRILASAAFTIALLFGGSGVAIAEDSGDQGNGGSGPHCKAEAGEPNAMGMQMKHASQKHGGIAAATQWHNAQHHDDLTVGEHQKMIKDACWSNPSGN